MFLMTAMFLFYVASFYMVRTKHMTPLFLKYLSFLPPLTFFCQTKSSGLAVTDVKHFVSFFFFYLCFVEHSEEFFVL